MSELLNNMSAPPRSEVRFEQEQLKKYIAFNPITLANLLGDSDIAIKDLCNKVKDYVSEHPTIETIIEKPTGYMIGEVVTLNGEIKLTKELNDMLNRYKYVECDNLELLIMVLCSTVGDLYIPNRTLSFESTKFDKILLFPESEVNS